MTPFLFPNSDSSGSDGDGAEPVTGTPDQSPDLTTLDCAEVWTTPDTSGTEILGSYDPAGGTGPGLTDSWTSTTTGNSVQTLYIDGLQQSQLDGVVFNLHLTPPSGAQYVLPVHLIQPAIPPLQTLFNSASPTPTPTPSPTPPPSPSSPPTSNPLAATTPVTIAGSGIDFHVFTLGFDATNSNRFHIVRSDTGGDYSSPQWLDNNLDGKIDPQTERDYPICYTRSGPDGDVVPTVGVVLANNGSTNINTATFTYRIRAKMPNGLLFGGPNGIVAKVDAGTQDIEATLTFNGEILTAPGIYTMALRWEVSVDGGVTWTFVGNTDNKTYVTNDDPQATWTYTNPDATDPAVPAELKRHDTDSAPYETVLKIGCEGAQGGATATALVYSLIWNNEFVNQRPSGVLNATQQHLVYWGVVAAKSPNPSAQNLDITSGLLRYYDGTCFAWAGLFADVLRAQGINAYVFNVTPPAGHAKFDVNTTAGQGSIAQRSEFNNHAIVSLDANAAAGIYDPSYGAYFATQLAWTDGMVSGFPGNVYGMTSYVKGSGGFTFTNTLQ